MTKINKLQLRAEIVKQINSLNIDDIYSTNGNSALEVIKSFDHKTNTLDILLKELKNSDGDKTQIIAYMVLELSKLEDVQEILWSYIRDSQTTDYIKEVSCSILRAQGGSITIEELSEYLNNPEDIIDAETKKLLEESFQNPEALIDFLDFLFALNEEEQLMLLESLKDDYPQNYVANILIPALNSNPSFKIKELIIDMLGETKSNLPVKPLKDIMKFSKDEVLEKKAKKSLNLLKLSRIDIKYEDDTKPKTHCTKDSNPYMSFCTTIDGAGNQGFIFSRIRKNESIQMFSVVINDQDGIVDCFGFNHISKDEFERIITRFESKGSKIEAPFSYVKYKLEEAENINKKNNFPISYEFIAWKELLADIDYPKENTDENVKKWSQELLYPDYNLLGDEEIFDSWFLEEDDNKHFLKLMVEIKLSLKSSMKDYLADIQMFDNFINVKIDSKINDIFSKKVIKNYVTRLKNSAYLLNIQDKMNSRNIVSSLVKELENQTEINTIPFFKDILKRSIYESILREKENVKESLKTKTIFENNQIKNKYNLELNELDELSNKLFDLWNN